MTISAATLDSRSSVARLSHAERAGRGETASVSFLTLTLRR